MKHAAVILANGDFPTRPDSLKILQNAETIVCCDGAAENLHRFGRAPDAIVGDLDSFPSDLRRLYQTRIIHVAEQETNDLAKAFRFACSRKFNDITIFGATGKREDHTLGNISLLADFAASCPNIRMITDTGVFLPMLQSGTMPSVPGQQISIFSFNPEMPVSSQNLKYPLRKLKLKRWWQATLNEAEKNDFQLTFPGPEPLILFLNFIH